MSGILDNKSFATGGRESLDIAIKEMTGRLDQRYPIERKVKFFLDIRGYLKLNAIKGYYLEFGSFRSWTQYAAFKILNETRMIDGFVGFDAFIGEPPPSIEEAQHMPVMAEGDFNCHYEEVAEFVESSFEGKGHVIRGDFRDAAILAKAESFKPVSLAVIDCNLASSLEASTKFVMKHAAAGCAVFLDDYFTNFGKGEAIVAEMCARLAADAGWKLIDHSFYAPFAKSFILAR